MLALHLTGPLTIPTRHPEADSANLALCRPVSAHVTTADPSAPPEAAVGGSPATAWGPASDPATPSTWTVRLDGGRTLGHATLTWRVRPLATYRVQVRSSGGWRTVASVDGSASDTDEVSFAATVGGAVRLRLPPTRRGAENPRLAEVVVTR